MRYLQLAWRGGKLAFFTVIGWLVVHGSALAEPAKKTTQETQGESYVVSYMMVILGVALGLLVVCRASRRRDRARPEHYDEAKAIKD